MQTVSLLMRARGFLLAADIKTKLWTVLRVQPTWTQDHRPISKRLEHRLREKFILSDSSTGNFFPSNVCVVPPVESKNSEDAKRLSTTISALTTCKSFAGLPTDPNKAAKGARRWNKLQYKWQEGDQASYDQCCRKF